MTDIFISYSHKDEAWKDALQDHLLVLQNHGEFAVWDDRQIQLGDDWYPAISNAIESAKVAVLLISADFLKSDFVRSEEIPKLLKRRAEDGLRMIPLIVRPCPWQAVPWLAELQGGTKDNFPLSKFKPQSYELEEAISGFVVKVNSLLQAAKQADQLATRNVEQTEPNAKTPQASTKPQSVVTPVVKAKNSHRQRNGLVIGLVSLLVAGGFWYSFQPPIDSVLAEFETTPKVSNKALTLASISQEEQPKRLMFEPIMTTIPAGSFTMGCVVDRDNVEGGCDDDEKPSRTVTVEAFKMGVFEVMFDEWDTCTKAGKCVKTDDKGWGRGQSPVIKVSWDDIQVYIEWLNQKTGKQYRLPTEAEWEYAARAAGDTAYPWGNNISCDNANYNHCGGKTVEVNSYQPNAFGLFNTAGNVWEWVADCWKGSYQGASATGQVQQDCATSQGQRVLRGGSWFDEGRYCRSANRSRGAPGERNDFVGFRLALGL